MYVIGVGEFLLWYFVFEGDSRKDWRRKRETRHVEACWMKGCVVVKVCGCKSVWLQGCALGVESFVHVRLHDLYGQSVSSRKWEVFDQVKVEIRRRPGDLCL
jgi:hypothetical protein